MTVPDATQICVPSKRQRTMPKLQTSSPSRRSPSLNPRRFSIAIIIFAIAGLVHTLWKYGVTSNGSILGARRTPFPTQLPRPIEHLSPRPSSMMSPSQSSSSPLHSSTMLSPGWAHRNATPTRIADVNPLAGTDSPTARTVFTRPKSQRSQQSYRHNHHHIVAALWSHLLDGDAGCLSVDTFGYTLTTPPDSPVSQVAA